MASSGSIAPVLTSPAVATTQTGWKPAASIGLRSAARSASAFMRKSASTGMRDDGVLPSPSIDAAFGIDMCGISEA